MTGDGEIGNSRDRIGQRLFPLAVERASASRSGPLSRGLLRLSAGLAIPRVQRLGRAAIAVGVLGGAGLAGDHDREQDDHQPASQ